MQVLEDTQTEGREFSLRGTYGEVLLSKHSGGTWTLQRKTPDDEWIDTNVTFVQNNATSFVVMPGQTYRIEGGTAGATAWAYDNSDAFRG